MPGTQVSVLNGGLAAWKAAGLPTASGPVAARHAVTSSHGPVSGPGNCGGDLGATRNARAPTLVDVRSGAVFG